MDPVETMFDWRTLVGVCILAGAATAWRLWRGPLPPRDPPTGGVPPDEETKGPIAEE